ncbi:MAG: hypothetical protein EF813_11975 [Methanosarcinales archaeon]|nr:MAG: hypothetical protein EF813_11975 [Methanosarcinales archaeon]
MKARYIIYCVLIALAVFSAPASADSNTVIVGDANSDGRITTADSMLALQMATGSMPPDIERADVNYDGAVNSLDALIIQTIAQKTPETQKTQVRVNAPDVVSGAFNATIDIYNVVNLDSGQFDLSFDPNVVNATAVCDGNINGTTVPINSWKFVDTDTIRVLFNLPGVEDTCGSGQIATISFEMTGTTKDTSVLNISEGLLVDTGSHEIPTLWFDDDVTLGTSLGTSVTANAPTVVSGTFDATIDVANITNLDSGQFDLSFDPNVVNVTSVDSGNIGGTEVPIDMWRLMDAGRVRVLFRLSGATGVSGSGSLATISFEITGAAGDRSVLNLSDGLLFDTTVDEIPATWTDDDVVISVPVAVNAPEAVSGTFDATIDVANVTNLDSGQFDLWFNSDLVNVTGVDSGSIGGTAIPVGNWTVMHGTDNWDCDKLVRVIFDVPGVTGVNGSGHVATIHFEVTGAARDTGVLDISDGLLINTGSDEIPTIWNDCEVTIGTPVTVNAPETVSGTFDATIDVADVNNLDSGQFDLSFNASVVNVTGIDSGSIGATDVRLDGWTFRDSDTVRVIFNLPGTTGISGSGHLVTIHFEVTGSAGDQSVLDISDGLLVNTGSGDIPAVWINDEVSV